MFCNCYSIHILLIVIVGNTPLHDAAVGGYIECARLLIASDCDVILKDNQNMTSADIAESYGHAEFAKELRKFERSVTFFFNFILYIFRKSFFRAQWDKKIPIKLIAQANYLNFHR